MYDFCKIQINLFEWGILMLKKLTADMIDNILGSSRTFIILFYSELTPTTPKVMEIFEDFDRQFKGKIDIYKCEIDKETGKLREYFQMNTLPAMAMMKNNKPYANCAGAVSLVQYQELIKAGIVEIMKDQKQQTSSYVSIIR